MSSATTIRGPRGHWLFGVLRQVQKDPLGLYSQAWREYGDYVRLRWFAGVYGALLVHPDAVEHVLQKNHRNYRKPDVLLKPMRLLVGEGLFTAEGDPWLRQRRLDQPAFNRQHIARLSAPMTAAGEAFLREREAGTPDEPVDMLDEMMRVSLRVASTTLFGTDVTGEADAIGNAYRTAFAFVSRRMNSMSMMPTWLPTPANRAFFRARNLLDRVVLDIIEARRRSAAHADDLLGLLLAARDDETGTGMSDKQVKDEVLTLLTAGHETVGAALAWSWYLLGAHPTFQNDLRDEARGVLGGRSPGFDDLPRLPLARAVFEEAMRLYPPAWGLPREAIAADEIDGFPIGAKSMNVVCQYLTHRHPDFWHEPDKFEPARFFPDQAAGRHRFAYFPFGGGPRVCIGNTFALAEGTLLLATISQRLRVELLPGLAVVPDPTFTLRPKHGVKARLRAW